jgi:hypothetical protein
MSDLLIKPGPQTVNLEQLAAAIQLARARVALNEAWLEAWTKRGEYERSYTRHYYEMVRRVWRLTSSGAPSSDEKPPFLENYLRWHKAYYEAEYNLRRVDLDQLKSHLKIHEAMWEEAKNPLGPRGNLGTV